MATAAQQSDQETLEFLKQLETAHTVQPVRRGRNRATNFFDGFQTGAAKAGGFTGGKIDRITEEWNPGEIGPNRAFQMDGKTLRNRARDLFDNNPFAFAAVNAYISNVIECGICPERDEAWESAWERWGGLTPHATSEADYTGDGTIYDVMRLWLTEILVAGGCLTHYRTMPRRDQRIPLAIELIPEERFADHLTSAPARRGSKTANPVWQGIEYDPASGRKLAYHLLKFQPNDLPHDPFDTVRLPAKNCRYSYMKTRAGQQRGTTVLKTAVMWLWALGYYTDSELTASSLKSQWAYMIKTDSDATEDFDWDGLLDSNPNSGTVDIYGNRIEKHEPGQIWRGAPGDEIVPVGPNVPQQQSIPWIKLIQEAIATGCGLSYYGMTRDYSDITLGTARVIRAEDKKRYRPLQDFTIHHFGNPTVDRFDRAAVSALIPGFPSPSEYVSQRDEQFEAHEWQPPGWESPNPKDDAAADDIRLANRTATRKGVLGGMGKSWRKMKAQIKAEIDDMREDETLPPNEQSASAQRAETFGNEDEL